MKPTLLNLLVCPRCHSELDLRVESADSAEIREGTLSCGACRAAYPIQKGIPRFVASGSYVSSFGRQWNWFRTVQLDSLNRTNESDRTLEAVTGWTDDDYRGRLVLDVGVGAGRFAEIAANKGAEVVGIDLSDAIDAAYLNLGHRTHLHLIQADAFAMPFRPATFDLAYAIGVLHHTPDPQAAFARVATVVKKGGGLAVYLYSRHGPGNRCSDLMRRLITTRLPARLMLALSTAAIPLYYVYRIPLLGKLLRLLLPISMHPDWRWRWLDTFDWYTPTFQRKFLYPEVFRWFRANGFLDVEVFDTPISMRGTKTA